MKSKFYTRLSMVLAGLVLTACFVTAQTTLEIKVAASLDDVEEWGATVPADGRPTGDIDAGSSDLEIVYDNEMQFVGLLFRDVQIPPGSVVSNAYVQFQVDALKEGVTDQPLTVHVYGAKEANTGDLTEVAFNVSSRPDTDAKVDWACAPSVAVGDRGVGEQTPDISAIINEIIGLPGWAAGNKILIVIDGDPLQSVDLNREMESADGDPEPATLYVTFAAGTGIDSPKEFSYSVYPNPTQGMLYIDNPSSNDFSYEVYNVSGQLVASRYNLAGSNTELDMSEFAKGIYFVSVNNADRTETHKLIVK
jgi:hypothetical protein